MSPLIWGFGLFFHLPQPIPHLSPHLQCFQWCLQALCIHLAVKNQTVFHSSARCRLLESSCSKSIQLKRKLCKSSGCVKLVAPSADQRPRPLFVLPHPAGHTSPPCPQHHYSWWHETNYWIGLPESEASKSQTWVSKWSFGHEFVLLRLLRLQPSAFSRAGRERPPAFKMCHGLRGVKGFFTAGN